MNIRMKTPTKIPNAYISVDVQDGNLSNFRDSLQEVLRSSGIDCEPASDCPHVSIAYGAGECAVEDLAATVQTIASQPFEVRASGFDIFEGRRTDFDYLVLRLCGEAFEEAVSVAQENLACSYEEKHRSHISLLRFQKGSLNHEIASAIVREMNATHAAAFALGKNPKLNGSRVNVFGPGRNCFMTVSIEAGRGMCRDLNRASENVA
jgi:2'-5' RNA ligase